MRIKSTDTVKPGDKVIFRKKYCSTSNDWDEKACLKWSGEDNLVDGETYTVREMSDEKIAIEGKTFWHPADLFEYPWYIMRNEKNYRIINHFFAERNPWFMFSNESGVLPDANTYQVNTWYIRPEGKEITLREMLMFVDELENLPEKWAVPLYTQEVADYCNKYGTMPPYFVTGKYDSFAHFPNIYEGTTACTTSGEIREGYTLISIPEFMRLVHSAPVEKKEETKVEEESIIVCGTIPLLEALAKETSLPFSTSFGIIKGDQICALVNKEEIVHIITTQKMRKVYNLPQEWNEVVEKVKSLQKGPKVGEWWKDNFENFVRISAVETNHITYDRLVASDGTVASYPPPPSPFSELNVTNLTEKAELSDILPIINSDTFGASRIAIHRDARVVQFPSGEVVKFSEIEQLRNWVLSCPSIASYAGVPSTVSFGCKTGSSLDILRIHNKINFQI